MSSATTRNEPVFKWPILLFHSGLFWKMLQYCSPYRRGSRVASILPFIRKAGTVFDDYATEIMGEAFDAACKELHDKGQPTIVYEVIAKRIIDAAKNGERNTVQLRNIGLAGLGFDKGDKQAS
jgi:hypothetical protein